VTSEVKEVFVRHPVYLVL